MSSNRLSVLTEIAILAALGLVLDKLVLFQMPQGGGVTLVMLPVLLLALRRGAFPALLAGFLIGSLQLAFGGYYLNLFQVGLDYFAAFTALGLAGFCYKAKKDISTGQILLATLIGGTGRLLCHFLAGWIFFADYAPEGWQPWIYSLYYNASYMLPSMALALALLLVLLKAQPKLFRP